MVDSGNQVLLLIGGRRSRREATAASTRSATGATAFCTRSWSALTLFTRGGLFALYEGIEKVRHPHHLDSPAVALDRAGGRGRPRVVLVPHRDHRVGARSRATTAGIGFIRHSKTPELVVVLLEDFAALIGLVLRAHRGRARRRSPATPAGTASARSRSACCSVGRVRAGGRGEEPAAGRIGRAAGGRFDRGGAGRRRDRPGHPPAHDAPRSRTSCWSRPRWRCRSTPSLPRSRPRSMPPRHGCGPRCRPARVIYLEPDLDRDDG